jgi:hypothetical protein
MPRRPPARSPTDADDDDSIAVADDGRLRRRRGCSDDPQYRPRDYSPGAQRRALHIFESGPPDNPAYVAGQAVTSATIRDHKTLLILTSAIIA